MLLRRQTMCLQKSISSTSPAFSLIMRTFGFISRSGSADSSKWMETLQTNIGSLARQLVHRNMALSACQKRAVLKFQSCESCDIAVIARRTVVVMRPRRGIESSAYTSSPSLIGFARWKLVFSQNLAESERPASSTITVFRTSHHHCHRYSNARLDEFFQSRKYAE